MTVFPSNAIDDTTVLGPSVTLKRRVTSSVGGGCLVARKHFADRLNRGLGEAARSIEIANRDGATACCGLN